MRINVVGTSGSGKSFSLKAFQKNLILLTSNWMKFLET